MVVEAVAVGAALQQQQQEKGGQVQASAASQHRCLSLYWTNTETQRRRHAVTSRSNLELLLCFFLLRKHSFAGLVKIAHWWCNLYMRPSSSLSIAMKTCWALVSLVGPGGHQKVHDHFPDAPPPPPPGGTGRQRFLVHSQAQILPSPSST